MKDTKKLLCIISLVTLFLFSIEAKELTDKKNVRIITDSAGQKVTLSSPLSHIAILVHKQNAIVALLGGADCIVATSLSPEEKPWLFEVNPSMYHAVNIYGPGTSGELNIEELAKLHPDVAFMSLNAKKVQSVATLGIPVVQVALGSFDGLKECVTITGEILGKEGQKKAAIYLEYLEKKQKYIGSLIGALSSDEKPSMLHIANFTPLMVDGTNTIVDEWITLAGGINAASTVNGSIKSVSIEEILQWNPDIIIIGGIVSVGSGINLDENVRYRIREEMLRDKKWQQVRAVQNEKVFVNPDGVFSWDRESAEEALQIQWAAKTIHPEKCSAIDVGKETQWFYKTFFGYSLSRSDAQRILDGKPPVKK